jgi:hypothetical protein
MSNLSASVYMHDWLVFNINFSNISATFVYHGVHKFNVTCNLRHLEDHLGSVYHDENIIFRRDDHNVHFNLY